MRVIVTKSAGKPLIVQSSQLLSDFDLFLIDAYGVLITSSGTLPGASEFLQAIEAAGKQFFIVTNDASRTPETCARVYRDRGLNVPVERILSAGLAISLVVERDRLQGATTVVLGTSETKKCAARAGANVIEILDPARDVREALDFEALFIGDDSGFDVLPTLDVLLTSIHKMAKRGKFPKLYIANPDLLYPRGNGAFAFTSGSLAKLLEIGLNDLAPDLKFEFEVLGKPARLLYDLALSKSGLAPSRAVMLGDQLHTDVVGAHAAGVKAALTATGITQLPLPENLREDRIPDFILHSL